MVTDQSRILIQISKPRGIEDFKRRLTDNDLSVTVDRQICGIIIECPSCQIPGMLYLVSEVAAERQIRIVAISWWKLGQWSKYEHIMGLIEQQFHDVQAHIALTRQLTDLLSPEIVELIRFPK